RELLLLIVNSPEHVLLLSPFILKELERVFEYDRVRAATKLTDEEVAEYLGYIRARAVSEIIFPGPAPRIVPSDADDDPVVHTAVVGRAEILCTLNRDFYHTSVLEYCKARGVLVGRDVAILEILRGRR
ncbi:MAG: PIN domain-containing protein, partial [Bryobacteraceae bacterium]